MTRKPSYEELEQRVKELTEELREHKRIQEQLKQAREEEARLLEMTNALSQELNLDHLLIKIMHTSKELLSAERCTLFLYDRKTDELWARATGGSESRDLRFPSHLGIAGSVFTAGTAINIPDAYTDDRFNPEIDRRTGFQTISILCMPVRNKLGQTLGVAQVLNKKGGPFTTMDEKRLEAFSAHACIALENAKLFKELMIKVKALQHEISEHQRVQEELQQARDEELQHLEMTNALLHELNLGRLLLKIMQTTRVLLSAERCTLFMYDEKTDELWARATGGSEVKDIRFPRHLGIAGSVFTSGETINIPDAYVDDRFNQAVDKMTGFRTRSILCMPVRTKDGQIIGVTQVLNKKDGPFTGIDERRLAAFSAQASIALENAKLFEDVLNMKNYNESMLESMSNGVISLDAEKRIVKCNRAALRILQQNDPEALTGASVANAFAETNPWVLDSIDNVMQTRSADLAMDTDLPLSNGKTVSVNLTIVPLTDIHYELIGSLLILEDITKEKRLKGTMNRYMAKEVVDRLLEHGEGLLGGMTQEATIMFTDIRKFTTISERNTPQETVSMLNEYFSIMVDIIFKYQGILDKYIGDAILAVFGAPFSTRDDPDHAVKTAIEMLTALDKFNQKRVGEDKEPISIGIGISTNNILSGNIGSLKRMDYTVIGDGVNLASRLEGANKVYGTSVLISEFTYNKLQDKYASREIDLIRVKGKMKPIGVYQILGDNECASFPDLNEVLGVFREGLAYYRQRDWQRGIDCFSRILIMNKHDTVSRLYVERCRHFAENPPVDDWDHAWTLTTK